MNTTTWKSFSSEMEKIAGDVVDMFPGDPRNVVDFEPHRRRRADKKFRDFMGRMTDGMEDLYSDEKGRDLKTLNPKDQASYLDNPRVRKRLDGVELVPPNKAQQVASKRRQIRAVPANPKVRPAGFAGVWNHPNRFPHQSRASKIKRFLKAPLVGKPVRPAGASFLSRGRALKSLGRISPWIAAGGLLAHALRKK